MKDSMFTKKNMKQVTIDEKEHQYRKETFEKIQELEREGRFDVDVEKDPPSRKIKPGEVDYQEKKLSTRMKASLSFFLARFYLNKLLRKREIVIDGIEGSENLNELQRGVIFTCNHFSPMDSFLTQIAYERSGRNKVSKKLFRIIKEGNYTSFPGFYGFLMRNARTLPLASDFKVVREFLAGVKSTLAKGYDILIYPEQSMWWNYRKPKPLKPGAFSLAVFSMVPVVPLFITMKDRDEIGKDGYPLQSYKIHIGKPILPDPALSDAENKDKMSRENSLQWKAIYEKVYQLPLMYTCEEKDK